MSRTALACALACAVLAALGVAGQRVGLALTVLLLALLASAQVGRRPAWALLALGGALAVQPLLRDAGAAVTVSTLGVLLAAGAIAVPAQGWRDVARAAAVPLRWPGGSAVVARASAAALPAGGGAHAPAIVRGAVLAAALCTGFGLLFASADSAFAEMASDALDFEVDGWDLGRRAALAVLAAATVGALVRERPSEAGPPARAPGRTELLIALAALAVLFAAFVGVQLQVLFGGSDYVRRTTGLGYGDYARHGFVQLVIVAALTLAVVAVAARRTDRSVRALLAVLCACTLVVLASANHRLGLVEEAYGFTRVRYGGHAIVLWLAAIFLVVLAAGALRRFTPYAPRTSLLLTLGAALAFSLSNPDARIAERNLDRSRVDAGYLSGLSADALPVLEGRGAYLAAARVRSGLERPDGLAGFNLSRWRAR